MDEYEAIAAYAGFALIVFGVGIIWQHYREFLKKRFDLLNYHSNGEDQKPQHPVDPKAV